MFYNSRIMSWFFLAPCLRLRRKISSVSYFLIYTAIARKSFVNQRCKSDFQMSTQLSSVSIQLPRIRAHIHIVLPRRGHHAMKPVLACAEAIPSDYGMKLHENSHYTREGICWTWPLSRLHVTSRDERWSARRPM